MEETSCEVIYGATTTLAVIGESEVEDSSPSTLFPPPFPSLLPLSLSYARQLGSADVEIKDTELQNVLSFKLGGSRNIVVYVSPAARNRHVLIPFRV